MTKKCANPDAPVVPCFRCGKPTHTCELEVPIEVNGMYFDYTCPVHPDGLEDSKGRWFCGNGCYDRFYWDEATNKIEETKPEKIKIKFK
jgi:hypothetical protein